MGAGSVREMKTDGEPVVRVFRTSDPERLVEGLQGADLHPCQLSHHPAVSELVRVMLPGACLDMVQFGPGMLFTGFMPRDCYTLIFILACPRPGRVFNFDIEHTEGYLGFFPPGARLDATTPAGYRNASLTLPAADLHAGLDARGVVLPDSLFTFGSGLRVGREAQRPLIALAATVREMISDPSQPLSRPAVRRQLEGSLRRAFINALVDGGCSHLEPETRLRVVRRHRKLRQARDYLAAHAHEPVYLDELCVATGVCRRAMENIFHDFLGLSPTAYLRHVRLHGVRHELLQAAPEVGLVKRVALGWGFWHLSHFAQEYFALFGESPSDTLRTAPPPERGFSLPGKARPTPRQFVAL